MKTEKPKCEACNDTGWYGDNGPGIIGNKECHLCDMSGCVADGSAYALSLITLGRWKIKRLEGKLGRLCEGLSVIVANTVVYGELAGEKVNELLLETEK